MKFRLAALVVAIALTAALIVFITLNSQWQTADLQAKLSNLDIESSGISDHFRESFRSLNNTVISYGINRNPAAWHTCEEDSRAVQAWMGEQQIKLRNPSEKQLLRQIESEYSDYLAMINALHAKIQSLKPQDSISLSDYAPMREKAQRLTDLSHQLSQVQYASHNELLNSGYRTLSYLRLFTFVSVGLMFVFGAALAVGIYRDLIAPLRVKLVESQALAQRQEKLASLGLLAAGVAHEIRTPLTSIKAALYTQKKKLQSGSEEHENLKVLEREISRLESIVNNFIRFARPAEPEFSRLNVEDLLLELQAIFTPQLGQSNIQLIMEVLAPMRMRADPAQIKQVFINLVQNAADSIGRDGRITLRASPELRRLGTGEVPVVLLEVVDTGKGIPPDVEKRLFDPFFTTKENGSGLGLSIAAQIVQKHGGELQYQTRVDHGTTFGVILPRLIE